MSEYRLLDSVKNLKLKQNWDLFVAKIKSDLNNKTEEKLNYNLLERDFLLIILNDITQLEKTIIKMRYGIGMFEKYTLKEIAERLNIPYRRVSYLHNKSIKKILDSIKKYGTFREYSKHLISDKLIGEDAIKEVVIVSRKEFFDWEYIIKNGDIFKYNRIDFNIKNLTL